MILDVPLPGRDEVGRLLDVLARSQKLTIEPSSDSSLFEPPWAFVSAKSSEPTLTSLPPEVALRKKTSRCLGR